MEKETILVRVISREEIDNIIKDLLINNVECKRKALQSDIKTKNVVIRCITIPLGADQRKYVRGMRAVGCFGFDNESTNYLTRGNNVCQDYKLVKYVKEINEMGY